MVKSYQVVYAPTLILVFLFQFAHFLFFRLKKVVSAFLNSLIQLAKHFVDDVLCWSVTALVEFVLFFFSSNFLVKLFQIDFFMSPLSRTLSFQIW